MPAYNAVTLLGNLTHDPKLSYTPKQTAVVDFGLAINRKFTAGDGAQKEDTCFIDCRGFGKLAENVNKYLKSGSLALVCGALAFDRWEAQDGSPHSKHRVIATSVQFMPDGKGKPGNEQDPGEDNPS